MTIEHDAFVQATKNIEIRFGVPFWEYMKIKRSPDVQEKINRSLRKETLKHATKRADSIGIKSI